MKKLLWIGVTSILCGLVLFTMLTSAEKVRAKTLDLQPVQVQNTGYTDSQGTIVVSAACPQNYTIQNGTVQISQYGQPQAPTYIIQSNGIDEQANAWTTTIQNQKAGSLSVTVTAICAQKTQ